MGKEILPPLVPLYDYDSLIKKIEEAEEVSHREAERYATKFFTAVAYCNKDIRKAKKRTIFTEEFKVYALDEAVRGATGANITERKLKAEANEEYRKAVRFHEEVVEEYNYYRRLYEVLDKGYTLFKMLSRE